MHGQGKSWYSSIYHYDWHLSQGLHGAFVSTLADCANLLLGLTLIESQSFQVESSHLTEHKCLYASVGDLAKAQGSG